MIKEEKTIISVLYTTEYANNKDNNLTSLIYPSGRTVTYTLDQTGKVTHVDTVLNGNPKTLASSISYLPYGGITGLTYGNTLSLSQGYDNQYRTSSIIVGSLINRAYGYDANGNIISDIDAIGPPWIEAFEDAGIYTYQQATNKLTQIQGELNVVYGYDANGNITSANNRTFTYDLSNRLITAQEGLTTLGQYDYNALKQRIKKTAQGQTTVFHYDLQGRLIAETDASGQTLVEYFYLGDQPLAMIRPTEALYYYHNDHLGTPQVVTEDTASVSWKAVYSSFGEAEILIGTVENPLRFPGQYYDQETGLHYNWNRYYDPKTGRYLTPDPIGLEGGINLFFYTLNNPINDVDHLGLQNANTWTYGEIRQCAITSPGNFTPPAGLADAKASIGACCGRGQSCRSRDGSAATARGDRAAWRNIVNATGGSDRSGNGNYMCVGHQNCGIVHRCAYCCGNEKRSRNRDANLTPTGVVNIGATDPTCSTIYFYRDDNLGWCPEETSRNCR